MNLLNRTSSPEIFEDENIQGTKHKMMDKMRSQSMFMAVGDTCKFVAGPLMGIGIGMMFATGAFALTLPAIAVVSVAATLLTIGVGSSFMSSRVWQSGQFDNFEINAKSTADHLVEKIKEENMCMTTEHADHVRKDGKSWEQVIKEQGAAKGQSTQIH